MTGQGPGNGLRQGAAAAAVGAAVALVAVFGLGHGSPPGKTPAGRSVRYNLYTHCGVSEARVGTHYYLADHPLSDGAGNPPAGCSPGVAPRVLGPRAAAPAGTATSTPAGTSSRPDAP